MTKAEIKTRSHNYTNRIHALDLAIGKLSSLQYATEHFTLSIIRAEYSEKLDNLSIDKEYMINFEGGGWNTTRATNDEDALKFAKAEYDGKHTKVKSVRIATKEGISAAMSNFY